ncbi:hypothetical protein [Epilithonimonas sp.]|uniref:hypothetical protein n=1 Tax=Epilithonimonas sp. TaxID=2894511 RepID=UPI0028992DEE|nr:hypothetical protein [Epilithonimonas sp.]
MKNITILIILFSSNLFYSQFNKKVDDKIEGKWNFNVFSDSIGFPMIDGIKTENKISLESIEFKKNNIFKANNKKEKFNGKWYAIGNNLILNFNSTTSILYEIMRLNNSRLELKEEGMLTSNLGFDKQ